MVRFKDGQSLDTVDVGILAAAKTQISSYPNLSKEEQEAFENAIDSALYKSPDAAEVFIRSYLEPQLSSTDGITHVEWLNHKSAFQHLRAALPVEWLSRFPQMPFEAARSLFAMAAKYGSKEEVSRLIEERLKDTVSLSGQNTDADKLKKARKKFWQLNAFFLNTPTSDAAWDELRADRDTVLVLEGRLGRAFVSDDKLRSPVTAEQVFKILDAFVDVWPKVSLPNSWGTDDPPGETAYRFLRDCIWKITDDTPERRLVILERIIAEPKFADYRDVALTLRAEAHRQIALQDFRAPHPEDINRLLDKCDIATVEDLRALMVEELYEIQKWLNGSETDPLDMFYSDTERVDENTARNRIVDRLSGRFVALGLSVSIEHYMASGNRCDISVSVIVEGRRRLLVTEVKGQWNEELFAAATAQLDQRYAIHPDAAKQGIYLVLWYGNGEKIVGRSDPTITSASELRESVVSRMPETLAGRVDVVVLDLSKPSLPISRRTKQSASTVREASNTPHRSKSKGKSK